jgi:hypothetical protein
MRRLVLLLPLYLLLARGDALPAPDAPPSATSPITSIARKVTDDGESLPDNAEMERLASTDPIAFLEQCLKRYDREVHGYRATLFKHERVQGKLLAPEVIDVAFREKPFSVRMDWRQGAGLAQRTAYVKGQNRDRLLVLGAGWRSLVGVVSRDTWGADARKSSRFPINEFGIKIGTQHTLGPWRMAKKRGDLKVRFLGARPIKRAGGRTCWELQRVRYTAPEDDGITEATFYFDTETWLQVGSYLTGPAGLVAEYWFRDIEINPDLPDDTFTREGVGRKN